ncbi:MAG: hypothetical protein IT447_00150 [Phycisphaerales bacterium]|nr:hypothetical protein [Phycisphaerales bacterium]
MSGSGVEETGLSAAHETMTEQAILAVGWAEVPAQWRALNLWTTAHPRRAIELMRMMRFDLTLVHDQSPNESPWAFIRRMRQGWPRQRWALVAPHLDEAREIQARSLAAWRIFTHLPGVAELRRTTNRPRDSDLVRSKRVSRF